jgi:hypothetical protein
MANNLHGDNPRTIRTPKTRAEFLEQLKVTCNVTKACELSGLARTSAYEWRDDDKDFAAEWQKSLDVAADLLEEEAVRRARDGTRKPVFQGGELVGHVQEYSDTLMIFLLKGAKPKKYNDRLALTGADGEGPVEISIADRLNRARKE